MADLSFHEACGRGDIDAVRRMLADDPRLVDAEDQYGWRPIFHAALWWREAIVRLLIDAGADLSAGEGYVLHYAGEVPNNKTIVSLLVQYGALDAHVRPVDDVSRQFLAAVFVGNLERVRALLRIHPHAATMRDGRGDEPIFHAARNGDTEIVRVLIEHGADVNAMNDRRQSVLYCAGGHGHLETLQLLLASGANADARFGDDGTTLLEWLAQYPDDTRYKPIAAALQVHATEGR